MMLSFRHSDTFLSSKSRAVGLSCQLRPCPTPRDGVFSYPSIQIQSCFLIGAEWWDKVRKWLSETVLRKVTCCGFPLSCLVYLVGCCLWFIHFLFSVECYLWLSTYKLQNYFWLIKLTIFVFYYVDSLSFESTVVSLLLKVSSGINLHSYVHFSCHR